MLRLLVGALLLANLLFFTWSRGWLDTVIGIPAQGEREPQRLANQVRPEQVTLMRPAQAESASAAVPASAATAAGSAQPAMPADSAEADSPATALTPPTAAASVASSRTTPTPTAASAGLPGPVPLPSTRPASPATAQASAPSVSASASAPGAAASTLQAGAAACLEVGPLVPADLAVIESFLKTALPADSWTERRTDGSGEWMIYMGPYPERELLERKKRELARIRGGVPQEDVTAPPELAGGISLGRFASQGAASATLAQYNTRGIRTARVVRAGPGSPATYLRVAEADPALARRVTALKLPVAGRSFTACVR